MKYIIPLSILFSILNLCISFFFVSECTVNEGVLLGIDIPYVEIISFILLLAILFTSLKIKGSMRYILLGITILGSGNLLERTIHGYICDYISLFGISVNIIDICITILVMVGVLICIFKKDEHKNRGKR